MERAAVEAHQGRKMAGTFVESFKMVSSNTSESDISPAQWLAFNNYKSGGQAPVEDWNKSLDKLNKVKKDRLILHPGPINRGVEITSDIVESNNSIILDQVENGVAIRMAIIYLLASKMNFSINE